jgi:hypothetical protein
MDATDRRLTGRLRPLMVAHRGMSDEPWRMDRLHSIFDHAARRLERECFDGLWDGAIRLMHDREGTLTIVWRSVEDFWDFARVVKAVWNAHEEWTPIVHLFCHTGDELFAV